MDPRVIPLTVRYPKVHPRDFQKILENKFRPYNIVRLVREHLPAPDEKDEDCSVTDTKSMLHLVRTFLIYCQIIIELSREEVRLPLQAALATYQDRLCEYSLHFTFEPIRSYHFQFHERRIASGIDDPLGWRVPDSELHTTELVRKSSYPSWGSTASKKSSQWTFSSKEGTENTKPIIPVCFKYNRGSCEVPGCKYKHVCLDCGGLHAMPQCSKRENPNMQTVGGAK